MNSKKIKLLLITALVLFVVSTGMMVLDHTPGDSPIKENHISVFNQ